MSKKEIRSRENNYESIFNVAKILFPSFTELQYMAALAMVILLPLFHRELVTVFMNEILDDFMLLFYPVVAVGIAIVMFTKTKFKLLGKIWICLMYYGLFALLAFLASKSLSTINVNDKTLFETINLLLSRLILIIVVARGVITFLSFRFGGDKVQAYVTQNFKDDQYHPRSFIIVFLLTFVFMYILQFYYTDPVPVAFLTLSYTIGIFRLIEILLPDKFKYIDK